MSRSRRILIPVAALALVAIPLLASRAVADRMHRGERMKEMVSQRIDAALDAAHATPPQRAAIEAARDQVFATVEEVHQEHRGDLPKVLALVEADRIDPAQVQALRAAHEQAMQKVGDAIVQAVTDAHDALTAEQRQAVVAWARAHREQHLAKMEHGGRGAAFMHAMITERMNHVLDEIAATPAQREVVSAARERVFAAVQANRPDPARHFDEAIALFSADRIDQQKVAALRAEHLAQARKMGDVIVQAVTEVHDALTTAQRQKVAELIREHHGHE